MKKLKNVLFTFLALTVSFASIVTVSAEETVPGNDNTQNETETQGHKIETANGDVVITSDKTDLTGAVLTKTNVARSDYDGFSEKMGFSSCRALLAVYRLALTKDGKNLTIADDDTLKISITVGGDVASDSYALYEVDPETGVKTEIDMSMKEMVLSFTTNKLSDFAFVGAIGECSASDNSTSIKTTMDDGTAVTFSSKKADLIGLTLNVVDLIAKKTYTEEEMNTWVNDDQKVVGFYDIKVTDNNGDIKVLSNGEYQVKIKLPAESEKYKYYRVGYVKDGEKNIGEYYDAKVDENGYIVFNTKHLSQYVFIGSNMAFANDKGDITSNEVNKTDTTTDSGDTTDNGVKAPNTFDGVGMYIAFGLVSLIIVGFTCGYLKKKVNEM